MAADGPIVVIKLGGSLLSLPDLPRRLEGVFSQSTPSRPLIVAGGGEVADLVRRWQPVHSLSDEAAHRLALRAVSLNEALLEELLPQSVLVADRMAIEAAWEAERLPILAAERFVRAEEETAQHILPHDWSVTSDSIAAWVARRLGGERLVLLKSVDLPPELSYIKAAEKGLVDAHFPVAAAELAVWWVNVRAGATRVIEWTSDAAASRRSHS